MAGINRLIEIGLDAEVLSLLNQFQSPSNVEIIKLEEIANLDLCTDIKNEFIYFKKSNVVAALYMALRQNRQLKIDESAEEIDVINNFESESLVVVEDIDEVGSIIAANYASFIKAHLKIVENVTKDIRNNISSAFRTYEDTIDPREREASRNNIFSYLNDLLYDVNLTNYKNVVFFSHDIPFGIICSKIPTAHFPISPDCGLFTLRNIIFDKPIRTVLIIEPQPHSNSESNKLVPILKKHNVFFKILKGSVANPTNVEFHIQHLPFDIILFSTHGGYPKGDKLSIEFSDPNGHLHNFKIRRGYSISPVSYSDKFEVKDFYEFEEFDGHVWGKGDVSLPENFQNVLLNLDDPKFAHVIECIENIDMKLMNAIRLYDDNYFPMLHEMGNNTGPIIIANICNSYHNLSGHFLFGGARCYLGTTISILNSMAVDFSNQLFTQENTISNIVSSFNAEHFGDNDIAPYVYVGSPHTKIVMSETNNKEYYLSNIKYRIESVKRYMITNPLSQYHERNHLVIKMLEKELVEL